MIPDKLLSIIIPAYNAEAFITHCLDSILNQPFSNMEVIVVDDGSTDSTHLMCLHKSTTDSRLTVLSQANQGVSVARNYGLQSAKGLYVWFVDSDDFISGDCIETLVNTAQWNSLDLLQFGWSIVSATGEPSPSKQMQQSEVLPFSNYLVGNHFQGVLWQSLIKRQIIGEVLFSNSVSLWEDGLFFMQLFARFGRAQRISLKAYSYYQHDLSITHNVPFDVCLMVSPITNKLQLPSFSLKYKDSFIAFYAALTFFSDNFTEGLLWRYMCDQNLFVQQGFHDKLVQNLFTYNYGLLKGKRPKQNRLVVLNRIRSFLALHGGQEHSLGFKSRVYKFYLSKVPIQCVDFVFCLVAPMIKVLVLRK